MRVCLINMGCKVNRVEIDHIGAQLQDRGAVISNQADADVVIINTCTVTGEAEKKTRKAVRQALKRHPHAAVLLAGCAVAIDPDEFTGIDPRVTVVGKAQAPDVAWELSGQPRPDALPSEAAGAPFGMARVGGGFRTRVGIKVQDGCNNACTYCIVHVARGAAHSEPLDQVEADVRRHAAAGARELVLTGINLGTYSWEGVLLPDLVSRLLPLIPEGRLRISSVEPCDVSDDLIALLAEADGRVCRHLHLPLQSGSSKVLAEMDRPYDAAYFLDLAARLRAAVPQLSLSTDIIVGFPGETEEDFRQTLEVARAAAFSKIHVFRYSRREGTPAAARTDQVPPQVIADRAHRLAQLGEELAFADARRRAGTVERILVESAGRGTTESYHTAVLPEDCAVGQLVELPLTEPSADGIFHL